MEPKPLSGYRLFPSPQKIPVCPFPVSAHPHATSGLIFFHLRLLVSVSELIPNIIIPCVLFV